MLDEKRKDHITFSVRGQTVETTLKTLSIFPDSKLYHLAKHLLRSAEHPEKQHERRATAPPALQQSKPSTEPKKTTTVLAVIPATPSKTAVPPTPTQEKHEDHPSTPHPETHKENESTEHKEVAAPAAPADGDIQQDNYGVTLVHEHREIHNHFPLASQDYTFETHSYALLGEPQVIGTPAGTSHDCGGHSDCKESAGASAPTSKECHAAPPATETKPAEKPAPKSFAELYPNGYPLDRDYQTFLKLLHYHDVIAGCGRVHYDAFVALEAKYWEVDYPLESKEGPYLALITAQRTEGMLRGHFAKYIRLSELVEFPFEWTRLENMLDYEFMGVVRKLLDEDWEHKWKLCGLAGKVIEDGDEVKGCVMLEHK